MPSFRSLVVPSLLAAMASASPLAMMHTMDPRAVATCMDGTVNDTDVQLALYYGGAGTTVSLCPGAVINFYNPVQFTAENQEVSTEGYPTGSSRATINVMGANQATAFNLACGWWCRGGVLRNIQVNGNRPAFGKIDGGSALVEVGGDSGNHLITQMNLYEPRGWSCLHVNEGYQTMCRNVTITENQVGPSGNSPNNGNQFVQMVKNYKNFLGLAPKVPGSSFDKRYETTSYNPGLWADGISLSCGASTVTDNVITDATDGGIVIFGSPGSVVANNHIRSINRNLLGGINLVDWGPWAGNFTDVVVEGNTIEAQSSMIKIGVAMGVLSWGSYNNTAFYNHGGTVRNNKFVATNENNGYFGFHISIAGHTDVSVSGNDVSESYAGGALTPACIPAPYAPPTPAMSNALVYDPWTTNGSISTDFVEQTLVFLICTGPSEADPPGQAFPDNAGPNYAGGSDDTSSTTSVSATSISSAPSVSSTPLVSSTLSVTPAASVSSAAPSVSSVSSTTSRSSGTSTSSRSSVTTSTSTTSSSTKQASSTTSSTKQTSSTATTSQTTSTKTPSETPTTTKTTSQASSAKPSLQVQTPSVSVPSPVVTNVPTLLGNNKSASSSAKSSSSSKKSSSAATTSTKLVVAKQTYISTSLVKATSTKSGKVLVETSTRAVTSVYKSTATERFVADRLVRTVTVVHPTTYTSLKGDEKIRMVKTLTSLSTTLVPTTTATSSSKESSSKKKASSSSTHSSAKPTQSIHRRTLEAEFEDEDDTELLRRDFAVAATPTLAYAWTPPGGAQPTRR